MPAARKLLFIPAFGLLLVARMDARQGDAVAARRGLYVNPRTGDDSADGLSPRVKGNSGPVKTISRAVRLAGPGDTVHLAKAVYHESIDLTGKSGEPGKPLIIDGHGATIDGSRPIDPNEWKEVGPGLYRNITLFEKPLCKQESWVWRWFFVFDGKVNRMGRCMKGNNAPYKNPSDLKPGEWTYQQKEDDAFYLKIDPEKKLTDYRVEIPWEVNGVSVHGANHDLIIRNLTAMRVINDGYNISPPNNEVKTHDVLFENIASIECGDDGLSAHSDCSLRVEGFYSTRNGTGLCTTGNSVNNRLHLTHNVGWEVYFYESPIPGPTTHVITNSFIECGADNAFLVQGGKQPDGFCTVKLENVVLVADPTGPTNTRTVRVWDKARLEGKAVTTVGLSFDVSGRGLSMKDSVLAGGAPCAIVLGPSTEWQAERNIYDIGSLRLGGTVYTPTEFDAYRRATGQDAMSQWKQVDTRRLLAGRARLSLQGKRVGAGKLADFEMSAIGGDVPRLGGEETRGRQRR